MQGMREICVSWSYRFRLQFLSFDCNPFPISLSFFTGKSQLLRDLNLILPTEHAFGSPLLYLFCLIIFKVLVDHINLIKLLCNKVAACCFTQAQHLVTERQFFIQKKCQKPGAATFSGGKNEKQILYFLCHRNSVYIRYLWCR